MDNTKLFQYVQIYNVPTACKTCGGVLVYRGLGEYICELCKEKAYDNYGKTRNYIEENPGASAVEIEKNTGVSKAAIREMLKESRFEIVEGTKSFLRCESCGKEVRSGRYCPECEKNIHIMIEKQQREKLHENMQGFAMNTGGQEGHRRFVRDK
ncbi:MAG: hypothetical protein HDR19_00445 [Lachnospiraceae bacterium]|nr:hypothetical protein [Lachnospiraceae bacterium]